MTNVDACKAVIDSQAAKGLNKYTVPLERSGCTVSELARHGAEEMADALAYFVELERRAKVLETETVRLRALLTDAADWLADLGSDLKAQHIADALYSTHSERGGCDDCNAPATGVDEGMGYQWCDSHGPQPSPLQQTTEEKPNG